MVSQIFIRVGPGERRLSLLENGKLVRAVVDRETTHNVIDGIYLGRVCKVNKMLDAAFVDIGNGIQGFLSATQAQIFDPAKDKPKPISKIVFEGKSILVRALSNPFGEKGPKLTANIDKSFSPNLGRKIKIDKKALDEITPPAEIVCPPDTLELFLLEHLDQDIQRICVNERSEVQKVQKVIKGLELDNLPQIEFVQAGDESFDQEDLEGQWDDIFYPTINLVSGGNIIIEELSTVTFIDVNSGDRFAQVSKEEFNLQINIEALETVSAQLRLRNISGQIFIDLLPIKRKKSREILQEAISRIPGFNNEDVKVFGFSRLGLLEVTRRRRDRPLSELLFKPYERQKTLSTICYEILYNLKKEMLSNQGKPYSVSVSPGIFSELKKDILQGALEQLQKETFIEIKVTEDPKLETEEYKIDLKN